MKRLLFCLFAVLLCCQANAAAVWDWSYKGQGDFTETTGHGTLTTASANLSSPQAVLSITGSYTDVTDNLYGLSPVPIVGITPVGTETHFTYDNQIGSIGPSGLLFDNGGLVFKGLREASNGFFPDQFGFVNIYTDVNALGQNLGYYVDTWIPTYAAGDFVAPVDFTLTLESNIPAVPETPISALLLAGVGYLTFRRQRQV